MAELITNSNQKNGRKRLSTRVDLTPMVDLGFLLITFFIFTTTMSEPMVMSLGMPANSDNPMLVGETSTLTIMLGKNNEVFYYEGKLAADGTNFKSSNFKEIRNVILNKKRALTTTNNLDKFMVVIKPTEECDYKNIVATLDEMAINVVKSYALADIDQKELNLIVATENSNHIL